MTELGVWIQGFDLEHQYLEDSEILYNLKNLFDL